MTFKEAATLCEKAKRDGWRPGKHRDHWQNSLATYAYPVIGSTPVHEIDNRMMATVLAITVEELRKHFAKELAPAKERGAIVTSMLDRARAGSTHAARLLLVPGALQAKPEKKPKAPHPGERFFVTDPISGETHRLTKDQWALHQRDQLLADPACPWRDLVEPWGGIPRDGLIDTNGREIGDSRSLSRRRATRD